MSWGKFVKISLKIVEGTLQKSVDDFLATRSKAGESIILKNSPDPNSFKEEKLDGISTNEPNLPMRTIITDDDDDDNERLKSVMHACATHQKPQKL